MGIHGGLETVNNGKIKCGSCNADVPETVVCLNCGKLTVPLTPTQYKLLQVIKKINGKKEFATTPKIIKALKKPRIYEYSVRSFLSEMTEAGLLHRPMRGRYQITDWGLQSITLIQDGINGE